MQLHKLEQEVIFFSYLVFLNIDWKFLLEKVKILTKWDFPTPVLPVINKCNGSKTFSKTEFIFFNLFLAQWHTILTVLPCLKFNEHTAFCMSSSSTWTDAICCGPLLRYMQEPIKEHFWSLWTKSYVSLAPWVQLMFRVSVTLFLDLMYFNWQYSATLAASFKRV